MKLLVATNNVGKIIELKRFLDIAGLELVTATEAGLPLDFDVEETGVTFEENACLKASEYAKVTGLFALADDSGLEVDALGGEPGVYSKRWAGENVSEAERNDFLLSKLADVPDEKRTARFVAALALAQPNGEIVSSLRGICNGVILRKPQGSGGFGYDPLFLVGDKTLAQMSIEEKNEISHRADAFRKIKPIIQTLIKD